MDIQLLIPMAGAGSRFRKAGYLEPKPLISIHGIPMIRYVIENLATNSHVKSVVFVTQNDHISEYGLIEKFESWYPGAQLAIVSEITRGAAETCLAAESLLDPELPLLIANSDQYIDIDFTDFFSHVKETSIDGSILCMTSSDPKWSYAKIGENGLVENVVEKQVISNLATVGIYYFKRAGQFFEQAKQMILENDLSNGEFYVAPVYNRLIAKGMSVEAISLGSDGEVMHGLGIPEDLERFIQLKISESIAERIQS